MFTAENLQYLWNKIINKIDEKLNENAVKVNNGLGINEEGEIYVDSSALEDSDLLTESKKFTEAINEVFSYTTDAFNLFKESIISKGGVIEPTLNKTNINNGILSIQGERGTFEYTKNYGNLINLKWIYDIAWDSSTAKKDCLLNQEDWPRYVYVWQYQGNYYATFFNYLKDKVDSFNNEANSALWWNIDRSKLPVTYKIDMDKKTILDIGTTYRPFGFENVKSIATNSQELFDYLGSEDAFRNRSSYFNTCLCPGFWENWGGFKRNRYSGNYDLLFEELCKKYSSYRLKKYYIWHYTSQNKYYISVYDEFIVDSGCTNSFTFEFDTNTLKIISEDAGSIGWRHGWSVITNIETCSQEMISYVHTNWGSATNGDGSLSYPLVESDTWHNLSALNEFS